MGQFKTPAIWIIPAPYSPTPIGGHTMEHPITFDFVAVVQNNDPDQGYDEAELLAAKIYDVISKERTMRNTVTDVICTRIDPSYRADTNKNIYWSAVQFQFKTQRRE